MSVERSTGEAAPRSGPPRHWADSRVRSIWRWQLILAASAVTITGSIGALDSSLFSQWPFTVGAVGVVVLTCGALLVPWHRVDRRGVYVLPMADVIVIGFLSSASEVRLGFLWIFPVAWIATYYGLPWLIGALSLIAFIMLIDGLPGLTPTVAEQFLIVLLCVGFMGVTINAGARRTRAYSHLLRRQLTQLDRTRRGAALQGLRTALLSDALDTGLAHIDRDGVLMDANIAFLRIYGASSVAEFTPTAAVEYDGRRGDPVDLSETLLARAIRGERYDDRRAWLFTATGDWRAFDVSSRPVEAAFDEGQSNLLIARDVTAAVDAERERSTVSSIVSHELRNPLTAILGHVDLLLERENLPDGLRRPLTVIDNASQRMQRLITTALAQYTPDAGAAAPVSGVVDLRPLVQASVAAFAPSARSAQITLHTDLTGILPVRGDAFRLRQAIDNVIGNAVKYTLRGGLVHLSARHDADSVTLEVADTGIGMTPSDIERVFEPGFRSDAARASGISGAGLGMVVVRDVAAEHGGSLDVRSAPGRGTTVTMRLPRATQDAEQESP